MPDDPEAAKSIEGADQRRVFVVYGRNVAARDAAFTFLRAVDLNPIEWEEAVEMTGDGSPYTGNIIETAFSRARAAVVLITGDDMARLGKKYVTRNEPDHEKRLTRQARANVIFEMGMAFGRFPDRTIIVEFGFTRPLTDTVGRNVIQFTDDPVGRKKLADRLKKAGCLVQTENRSDWLKAGDFASAFHEPDHVGGDTHAGLTITRRRAEPEEGRTYRPKVWVDVRNDSGACLEVSHLGWISTPDGISIKYGPPSMQLKIQGYWCPEKEGVEQLHVAFGQYFRTWVQPTSRHDMKDLDHRCESAGKIGNLWLRVDDVDTQLPV